MKRIDLGGGAHQRSLKRRFSTYHSYQQRKKVAKKEIATSTSYFILDNESLKKAPCYAIFLIFKI